MSFPGYTCWHSFKRAFHGAVGQVLQPYNKSGLELLGWNSRQGRLLVAGVICKDCSGEICGVFGCVGKGMTWSKAQEVGKIKCTISAVGRLGRGGCLGPWIRCCWKCPHPLLECRYWSPDLAFRWWVKLLDLYHAGERPQLNASPSPASSGHLSGNDQQMKDFSLCLSFSLSPFRNK